MTMKKRIVLFIGSSFALILLAFIIYLTVLLTGQYVIDEEKLVMKSTTLLVDQNGELITQLYRENREPISILDVPQHVQDAFIAIEDVRFYEHQGFDMRAIGRALYRDIAAGAKVEGGSTITQQLAKNVFLSNEKSWLRKTQEVSIAMNLERRYSKDEILEMYLNQIYFGHGVYGIQAAASLYFNKDVSELTVEEGALLAGLPKAPNAYSPLVDIERSKERRDLVLSVMQRNGFLSADEAVRLKGRTVAVAERQDLNLDPYFTYIDMVMNEAEERYQLTNEELLTGGYTIVVPMDEQLLIDSYTKLQADHYFPSEDSHAEAAFVLIDHQTGGVLAAHGGREYVRKGLNRVDVKRQPGSTFKPIAVFAPALMNGYEPYSLLKDEQIDYDGYSPRNYNDHYQGEVSLYEAIIQSSNAPAVWLLDQMGLDDTITLLNDVQIEIEDRGLAMALGGLSEGVSPLELTAAYQIFANGGYYVEPSFILEIYSRDGEKLGETSQEKRRVVDRQLAWDMTRMLESVVQEGTATAGETQWALAGKTGTTSFPDVQGATRDAWFVGYTPKAVGAVWMGYDVTTMDQYFHGGSQYPTILFKDIISEQMSENSLLTFEKPIDVTELERPIKMPASLDLQASKAFGGRAPFSVRLNWTETEDERVQYTIYEISEESKEEIATVTGIHEYTLPIYNPFITKTYQVVSYNHQTEKSGEASNLVEATFQFGFH
ncbi:transglycosylase domain-containing protein [Halalkalibacter hemicellulosilyticus]|uniref:Multimodular transpeptidase-transglycosylase n=1 Tax=Halalkalibacter hemicellulosilyticusJCM 9152 TaxID=1236971 RepID=W4QEM6_9BACI|nr:multimodular transpeptidase-transglycosylase [Halalkalibacter hemicellulosilyticusJCM 9152]